MEKNQDDFLFFIWTLIESLLSDYIDAIVAIAILIAAVLIPTLPPIITYVLIKVAYLKKRAKLLLYVFFLCFFLATSYSYFATLPVDYIRQLCWRESPFWTSCSISNDEGERLSGLHYNIILMAKMDTYFMSSHLDAVRVSNELQGLRRLIAWAVEIIVLILDLPAILLRYTLWWAWSFSIRYYLYLCPYVVGSVLYALATLKMLLLR